MNTSASLDTSATIITLRSEARQLANFSTSAEVEKLSFSTLRRMEATLVAILELVNFKEAVRAQPLLLLPISSSPSSPGHPQTQHKKLAESVHDLLKALKALEKFADSHLQSLNHGALQQAVTKIAECSSILIAGHFNPSQNQTTTAIELNEIIASSQKPQQTNVLANATTDFSQTISVDHLMAEIVDAMNSDDRRCQALSALGDRLHPNFSHTASASTIESFFRHLADSDQYPASLREDAARILDVALA